MQRERKQEGGGTRASERELLTHSVCVAHTHTQPPRRGQHQHADANVLLGKVACVFAQRNKVERILSALSAGGGGGWGFAAQPSRSLVEKIGVEALSNSSKAAAKQQKSSSIAAVSSQL